MTFVVTPYVLAQSFSALISILAAVVAWRRRKAPGGTLFGLMMTAVALWTAGVSLEESAVDLGMKILLSKVSYLGVVNVAPLFVLFTWIYRGGRRHISARAALLWVIPAATLGLVATNEMHGLIWPAVSLVETSGANLAVYAHGPAWWVFSIYNLVMALTAAAYVGSAALHTSRLFVRQTASLLAGAVVIAAGFVVYVAPGNPVPGLDLPALSFALAGLLFLWGLTRGMMLALSPIAREMLVEALPDGLIVTDAGGRVVDANPAARFFLRREAIVGLSLADALSEWPDLAAALPGVPGGGTSATVSRAGRTYEAVVAPLTGPSDDSLGRMVTLRDITERLQAREASAESDRNLRELLGAAQRQAKELELLDQVRTSLTMEMDLPVILRTVVEGIARSFGYTLVSLYLLEDGVHVVQHQVGYEHVIERIPTDRGIMGRVIRSGVAELVANVRDDPEFIGAVQGIVSEVTVPLFDRGTPVGVLNVESVGGVVMGPQDLHLMTILGEHVSIAFSKARLYAQARENEERYRALVTTLAEGVAVVDLTERFTFANPAAEKLFGVPPNGLAGRSLAEFLSPEELEHVLEETGKRKRGESSVYEMGIRRPDGQARQIELIAEPRRGLDGKVSGTLGILRDVTELRRLQRSLEAERALLLTLIDSLPDYVYLKDRDSRFILANKAQALLAGAADPKELVGKTDHDFVPKELADRYRAGDLQVMQSRASMVNVEEPSETAGGEPRRILTTKVPIFDANGDVTGVVGISRDVTDITRAEEEKLRLQEQLQQSQKMEAVGRLAGGIAHDFNNILTVITGYCEMALEEAGKNSALRASLGEIKRASRRSAALISQLLTFSRRQVLLPRVFDLAGLVDGMEGMLLRLLGEDVRLLTSRVGESLLVNADPGRIEQVIMNLAVNSRDAMPGGGELTIRARAERLEAEDLSGHPEVTPGEFVSLTVEDTGLGMDAATQERIFEPFFTTKDLGKGTGLGLATVYGIVRQSNGHVTCRSTIGRGTTFTVYLPRVTHAAERADAAEDGHGQLLKGTERILLVEDDESVRRFVGTILEEAGYSVLTADSGAAALDLLSRIPEPPQVLLTDVIMPGMDGRVLAQEVMRKYPGIGVLYMSGYAEVAAGLPGFPMEDPRLIQKPFSAGDLLKRIRTVLS